MTCGGFTLGLGVTTSAGAALIGHGLATTTYHAQDIKVPQSYWKNAEKEYKNPKPHVSGKEGSKDVPSWAKGNKPYASESGKDFAERLLDEKYGSGQYPKGPKSEFNQIKKRGDRAWE